MKKNFIRIVVLIGLVALTGCSSSPPPEKEEPIGAIRQHDTRVILICRDKEGEYHEKSLHISESVTCGDKTFTMGDFARKGQDDLYVAFPGQKKELKRYLQKKGDHRVVADEPLR